ncbi:hypothetical protein Bca52824_064144 [Brassica carinata]|uniref:Uncharacterized protein n=1 Tax=Brassica carinata TaxID=52824 RepID=A0A8X7QLB4_BRACI|nr:hypothetical protein Bca52824_064144 [Brassica carinata]
MSSSSSSISRQGGRRTVHGVPNRCWCGKGLDTWVSETKENPYHDSTMQNCFYVFRYPILYNITTIRKILCDTLNPPNLGFSCEHNKSETHLFEWVDEALLDEIRIVDAKRVDLLHELQALTGKVNVELESHRLWLVGRAEEMRNEINENMVKLTKAIDESTSLMKAQIDAKVKTHTNSKWSINQTAATMAMIGAMTYLYWKLL